MSTRCLRSQGVSPQTQEIDLAVNSYTTKQVDDSCEVSSAQDEDSIDISLHDDSFKMPLNDTTNDPRSQPDVGGFKLPSNVSTASLRLGRSSRRSSETRSSGCARRSSFSSMRDDAVGRRLRSPFNVSSSSVNLPPSRDRRSSRRSQLDSSLNVSSSSVNLPPSRDRRSSGRSRLDSSLNMSTATVNLPPTRSSRLRRGRSRSCSENGDDLPPVGSGLFKSPITISNSSLNQFLRKRGDDDATSNLLNLSFSSLGSFSIDCPAQDAVPLNEIDVCDLFFTVDQVVPDVPVGDVKNGIVAHNLNPIVWLEPLNLGVTLTSPDTTTISVPQSCQGIESQQSLIWLEPVNTTPRLASPDTTTSQPVSQSCQGIDHQSPPRVLIEPLDSTHAGNCGREENQPLHSCRVTRAGNCGGEENQPLHSCRVQCVTCSRCYKHKGVLSRHITRKCGSKMRLQCPKCSKAYFQKKNLEHHETLCGGRPRIQSYNRCSNCKRKVASKVDLQAHKQKNCYFSCKICKKTFKYLRGLNSHMKLNFCKKDLQCSGCHRCYKSKGELEKHAQSCTKVPENECRKCGLYYRYKRGLYRHQRTGCALPEAKANEARPFKCMRCPKSYKRKEELERHAQFECGNEPRFICDLCGYKFKHKHHMKRHMRLVHKP